MHPAVTFPPDVGVARVLAWCAVCWEHCGGGPPHRIEMTHIVNRETLPSPRNFLPSGSLGGFPPHLCVRPLPKALMMASYDSHPMAYNEVQVVPNTFIVARTTLLVSRYN